MHRSTIHVSLLSVVTLSLALGIAAPARAQNKVLFDAAHGQMFGNADWVLDEDQCGKPTRYPTPAQSGITSSTSETYWRGAFSAFGVALAKAGYALETLPPGTALTYGNTSNPQDLSYYDVFIVPEPNVRFTTAEKTAIVNFVRGGGGLFMIADHWNSDRNSDGWDSPEVFNDMMVGANWGIHFQVSGEADNYFNDAPDANYTADGSSPILYGPAGSVSAGKGLGLAGATSMVLSPSQNATAKGHVWKTNGTRDTNTRVTFATTTDGGGRVAAIGDSSPSEDATNGCSKKTYNGWGNTAYNNAIIHLNAVAWLAAAGAAPPDTQPPTAPSGLVAAAGSASEIDLAWSAATDNIGVVDYHVYRSIDGANYSAVAATNGLAYTDSGLAASTTYFYRVTANDAAGNESAASNTASATTDAGGAPGNVIINEILANEPGSDVNGEFVELVNVGGTAVDIGGWTISDSTGVRHTFAANTQLGAGKAIAVFGGAAGIPVGLANAVAASTGTLGLGNSGDTVTLKNAGAATVDGYTYPSSLAGTDGVSMNRSPDTTAGAGFVLHTAISTLTSSAGKRADGSAF